MTAWHRRARPDLLGRSPELVALRAALERTPAGGGCLLLVGEPGIGKSALLYAAIADASERGMAVLPAAGVEAEAPLPFAGLHQLLRPLLPDVAALPAAHRTALLRALGVEGGPRPEPFLVALAALGLLDRAAEPRPLLVAVDDLQWLDEPSHRVLAFVARRIEHQPIAVMAAVRAGSGGPLVDAGLPVLEVRALDEEAARAVLTRHGEHLGVADRNRILQVARGNPLALVELPLAVGAAAPGPDELPITGRLERTFAGRVRELGRAQRDLLLVAALDAHDDLTEVVAAASALTGEPVGPGALDAVVEAGLLDVAGTRLRFRHPLVRSAVVGGEPVARRRAGHAALAAVLQDEPFRRSWHRAQAVDGLDDELADELERHHRWALSRGSGASVIWMLERAAELTSDRAQRGRRLLLAAEQAFELGRADTVDRLIAAAARYPLAPVERARMAWLSEIFHDGVPGDDTRIRQLCAAAGEAVTAGDPDLALDLLRGAALRCWWAGSPPEVRWEVVEAARTRPELSRDPRYASVLAIADPVAQCAPVLRLLDAAPVDGTTDVEVLRYHADAAHAVGDPVRAADLLDRAEPGLRDQGRLAILQHVLDMQVQVRIELGDWRRAAAAAEESRRLAPETGQPIWVAGYLVGRARLAALRGEGAVAVELAAQAEEIAHQRHLTNILACAQLARGTALCAAGRYADGYLALRRMFDAADPVFDPRERYGAVVHLADAAVRSGRRDGARAVLAGLEQVAAVAPAPLLAVHLRYARAVLADDAEAVPLWAAARAADLVRWPWMRACTELAHGSWLRRQRRVVESREPLRAALSTFRTIGAAAWAGAAAAELRAAGDADSLPVVTDRPPLTAREWNVARLAADGHSNREIAQRLNLSHRTVGAHLRSIYPKLGVTSRTQLRAALDRS